jgi:hypothetical protein
MSDHILFNENSATRVLLATFLAILFTAALLFGPVAPVALAKDSQGSPDTQKAPPTMGTIKSISGNTLVVTNDAGADTNFDVRDSTKILRVVPGMKDLKDAQTIALKDLAPGDRILVRPTAKSSGASVTAASIYSMAKADVTEQHNRERASWQSSGVAGLVNSVDSSGNVISLTMTTLQGKKTVSIRVNAKTILRRYAQGSVKFDDAKPAPLGEIRPGDQLRARGDKSADGSEVTAVEVVSGSFRNISGTISSLDASQNTFTVQDLATKKNVTVKITSESQLRKLPTALAQRIAVRLKGDAVGGDQSQSGAAGASGKAAAAKEPGSPAGGPPSGSPDSADARPRAGRGMGGPPDFQQIINRQPAVTLADLHKDDAILLVGTEGSGSEVTAITLLAGVEPILQGSPNGASSILSPWSLSGAPTGESGTP